MKSDDMRPFRTCPREMSMKRGMTGLVRISSRSNCTASAASWRAFKGSWWHHRTTENAPSGMGPAPWLTGFPPPAGEAWYWPEMRSLLRWSLCSSVSFFFLCRRLRWGRSSRACRAARALAASAPHASAASAGRGAPPAPSAGGSRWIASSAESCPPTPGMNSARKTHKRTRGRLTKFTTVGRGPMTTVVSRPRRNRRMPIRHRYAKNCLMSPNMNTIHNTFSKVWIMPASNEITAQTNPVASSR
mmetsp:Transcript_5921/g.16643  ORF Transcript_5921/g.16643 Transcript_5921/m.16643 type:complete len:245 (-) Transcript_5921:468-1202(-)